MLMLIVNRHELYKQLRHNSVIDDELYKQVRHNWVIDDVIDDDVYPGTAAESSLISAPCCGAICSVVYWT